MYYSLLPRRFSVPYSIREPGKSSVPPTSFGWFARYSFRSGPSRRHLDSPQLGMTPNTKHNLLISSDDPCASQSTLCSHCSCRPYLPAPFDLRIPSQSLLPDMFVLLLLPSVPFVLRIYFRLILFAPPPLNFLFFVLWFSESGL